MSQPRWLLLHICNSHLIQPRPCLLPANITHKTSFPIQNDPTHTQILSEMHQKYHKLTVYEHYQLKHVVYP